MHITSDKVFAVGFAGSAVTAGMLLVAETLTARAGRRRAARRRRTVVVNVSAAQAGQASESTPEHADV
ncbi:hypothetical protein ACIQF6_33950 [Kitasatospora sp. NPDC092948]|uniref:hypothetical protein n=1 Tax=Kitasatospora sp. NPDC092948 TaxID=3364088 RepID=UPI003811F069